MKIRERKNEKGGTQPHPHSPNPSPTTHIHNQPQQYNHKPNKAFKCSSLAAIKATSAYLPFLFAFTGCHSFFCPSWRPAWTGWMPCCPTGSIACWLVVINVNYGDWDDKNSDKKQKQRKREREKIRTWAKKRFSTSAVKQ